MRVRGRRALIPFHLRLATRAPEVVCVASLDDRQFSVVIVGYVSGVILYFTERKVAAVHCRCDIKAAACNKIETFRPCRLSLVCDRSVELIVVMLRTILLVTKRYFMHDSVVINKCIRIIFNKVVYFT